MSEQIKENPRVKRPEWLPSLTHLESSERHELMAYITQLEQDTRKLLEVAKALPLAAFDKDMDQCDAAEFVDNAGDFVMAMELARAFLAETEPK